MNLQPGRLGHNPYRRSVYNRIQSAHVGTPDPDAAYVRTHAAVCPVTLPVSSESLCVMTVFRAFNELWAQGVRPKELRPVILLPESTPEEDLRHLIDCLCAFSLKAHITIGQGHIEVTDAVKQPVITGSISGSNILQCPGKHHFSPGNPIVMTGWTGLSASFLMAAERETELSKYFPVSIIRNMKKMGDALSTAVESAAAAMSGARIMIALSEGGIFTALWDLSQRTGTGLSVDLRKIPILQETIEFSNYYDINPYQMSSDGALLALFDSDRQALDYISLLKEKNISASLIGHLTENRDKIIRNGEEIRYLDRPVPDEIMKIFKETNHECFR